jgi:hypothetical protein
MSAGLLAVLLVVGAAGELAALPPASRDALAPAVAAVVERYNATEDALRTAPRVQETGPEGDPAMLWATYRRAGSQRQVLDVTPGPPLAVTVRVRAAEMEKRVTNVNGGDLHAALARAPWRETPRGYLLDFRFEWDGAKWRSIGEPEAHPTLGVVGRPDVDDVLERAAPSR